MTAVIFCLFLIVGAAHFYVYGPFLYGERSIYTIAYWATTICAIVFCLKTKDRSNIAAAVCIFAVAVIAPWLYSSPYAIIRENAILWSAFLDVCIAYYFICHGTRRWEILVGMVFVVSVAVSLLSMGGLIPDHMNRPYMFIAWSQPDLTALLGHAANIIVGFGAADGGRRIYNYMAARRSLDDWSHGVSFMLRGDVKVES